MLPCTRNQPRLRHRACIRGGVKGARGHQWGVRPWPVVFRLGGAGWLSAFCPLLLFLLLFFLWCGIFSVAGGLFPGPLPVRFPPPVCGVVCGSFRSLLLSCAVHVRWRSFRFIGSTLRPVLPGPVVGLRTRSVLQAIRAFILWLCRGCPILFPGGRRPVRRVLGSPAGPGLSLVLCAPRPGVTASLLAGLCPGLPAASTCPQGWRFASPGRPLRCVLFPVRWRLVVASLPLLPATAAPAVVGFSGGRRLSPAFRPVVAGVVASVLASGRSVAVGCAGGADDFVRAAAPNARVFTVPGSGWRPAAWFAARSIALVQAAANGGSGSGFVAFPAAPCPAGLFPSPSAAACFCGLGSGSWASAAFAAGLSLPVVVFPCGFSALPPWGNWVSAGSGVWASGFRLVA